MGDGCNYGHRDDSVDEILFAALSRTFSRQHPDDDVRLRKYEKALNSWWQKLRNKFEQIGSEEGYAFKSISMETGAITSAVACSIRELCDLVVFEALGEGRQIHLLHPCGKIEPVEFFGLEF